MTTHFSCDTTRLHNGNTPPNTSNLIRLLCGFAVLLIVSSVAVAQPRTGTVKKLTLKSAVLGEDRIVFVRTPVGYESNKVSYPVLYMTDGDSHINQDPSLRRGLPQSASSHPQRASAR